MRSKIVSVMRLENILYLLLSVLSTTQVSCAGAHKERSYSQMSLGDLNLNFEPQNFTSTAPGINTTSIRDSVTGHRQDILAMDEE